MTTSSDAGYRTPLSRARGLGASHTGVGMFIAERVTWVALIPLLLWAVWAMIVVAPGGYAGATAFLRNPVEATLAVLLLAVGLHHTHLGVRAALEDYIGGHHVRLVCLLLNSGVALLAGALGVVAILKVAFSAAA